MEPFLEKSNTKCIRETLLPLAMVVCVCASAVAQSSPPQSSLRVTSELQPVTLENTVQCDVVASSGSAYRLFIDAPVGEPPTEGWPVVYLTDANQNFCIVSQIVRRLSRSQRNAIVVGIGYAGENRQDYLKQRSFDLTFPVSKEFVSERLTVLKNQEFGGAERFLSFLVAELRPWLASQYPIDASKQTLVGHSFGGLFAIYAAMTRPEAFSNYVAISVSVWWADGGLRDFEEQGFELLAALATKPHFFVAVGELERGIPKHLAGPGAWTNSDSPMIDEARELVQRIIQQFPDVDAKFVVVPGAHHGSVFIPAVAQGLAEAFQQEGNRASKAN